jgi:hypothetical protein
MQSNQNHHTQIQIIQRQLMEMGFEITMINKLFTYYNITSLDQAIDYLDKTNNKWNHPFVNYSNEKSICLVCKEAYDTHNSELQEHNIIKRIPSIRMGSKMIDKPSLNNSRESGASNEDIRWKGKVTCQICFEQIEENTNILPCKEKICSSCVVEYIAAKITTAEVVNIKCPNHQCAKGYIFDEEAIRRYTSDAVFNKYMKFKFRHEISKNKNLALCPFEDCESFAYIIEPGEIEKPHIMNELEQTEKSKELGAKLIKVENREFYTCQNGHRFCITCNQPYHPGIDCEKKMEKEFTSYVNLENVKKCPECGFFIKKDGGCNHITCGNLNCKYEFCWICMKKYTQSHYSQPFSTCYGLNYADDRNIMVRYAVLKYFRIVGLLFLWLVAWILLIGIMLSLPSVIITISFLVTTYREINRLIKVRNTCLRYMVIVMFHSTYLLFSVAFLPIGYWCLALSPVIFLCYVVLLSTITRAHFLRRRPLENNNELVNMENLENLENNIGDIENVANME